MIYGAFSGRNCGLSASRKHLILLALVSCWLLVDGFIAQAQDTSKQPPSNPNQQDAPPEAGGPQNDVGPYVVPKKKEEPPPPAPERPKKIDNMPNYSISVEVPLVNLDVLVTTKDGGQTVPGLRQENFKIFEDGVEQKISTFNQSQAPITAVLLVEFASTNYGFMIQALNASYAFADTLKKDDWVAVISYDMKPQILADFTQDKRAVYAALNQLRIPGFAETNLFEALFDTLDRVDRIEGKKYIILVTTGIDTFSKLTLDKILKKIKTTKDVTIYPISVGWVLREYCDAHPPCHTRGIIPVGNMDYLQAENEMKTFASLTGGRAYFPRFQGELPEIFHEVAADIRSQYSIS